MNSEVYITEKAAKETREGTVSHWITREKAAALVGTWRNVVLKKSRSGIPTLMHVSEVKDDVDIEI